MEHVKQEVFPIDEVDVAIIRVGPLCGPCFDKLESVAAVLNPRTIVDDYGLRNSKMMFPPEALAEFIVGNVLTGLWAAVAVFLTRATLPILIALHCIVMVIIFLGRLSQI
jgi:hypothetical protein